MRPSLILATAVSGVIVALAYVALLKPRPAPEDDAPAGPTITGKPPAFHLDATPDDRRAILEATFPKIASERAERLGAVKDDIALLLDEPEAIRYVLSQWHIHRTEGRYAEAAFADLFRLVKHPDFVGPTGDLLDSTKPEIRRKALQSAETQASPALGSRILRIFREARDKPAAESQAPLRMEALRAAYMCRGDAFPAFLAEAMADPSSELVVRALSAAADLEIPGLDVQAREVLRSQADPRIRLHAAALLLRQGDPSAVEAVVAAIDPRSQGLMAEAVHLVSRYRIAAAADRLREVRSQTPGELGRLVVLALLRLGDQPAWDEVVRDADASGGDLELDSLRLLAASGNVDATPILLHALDRGGAARAQAIAAGVTTSGETAFLPVIRKLIEQPVAHPAELDEAPRVGGVALVPRLGELLHAATDQATQARLLSWLAQIGGPEAREAMLRERRRIPRLVPEQIRLVDLEARRLGIAYPPLIAK
jgi:hypothetical protein